jgi:hypothetical protein
MKNVFFIIVFLVSFQFAHAQDSALDFFTPVKNQLVFVDNLLIDNFDLENMDIIGYLIKLRCKNLNLTQEQRAEIRLAMKEVRDLKKLLAPQIRQKYAELDVLIDDVNATVQDARVINSQLTGMYNQVTVSRKDMKAKILFEILNPDQRRPAIKCSRLGLKKLMKKVCSKIGNSEGSL